MQRRLPSFVLAGASPCWRSPRWPRPSTRTRRSRSAGAEPLDTLNPATTGNRDVGPIDANIFDTLVWLTPDFKITPDLATKWEISPDKQDLHLHAARGRHLP